MTVIDGIFEIKVSVGADALDANGHVNNVEYIRWMQEAAAQHSEAVGCTAATVANGSTWVVRSHHIEYLSPSFESDELTIRTWISDAHRVRSKRKYEFVGHSDGKVRANAWTEWVFMDIVTGRPRAVPDEIFNLFKVVADAPRR